MDTTVIVFQEDCILAAKGKDRAYPLISRVRRIPLPGTGDTFARWIQALSLLDPEWKAEPVRLVLPAGMSATRVLSLPPGRGRQLSQMAERQVENSFRNEIADYSIAFSHKKDGVDLCAGGADKGVLEHFMEICEEAGISMEGITVPLEGYLRILGRLEDCEAPASICLFFEEDSMTSILRLNGRCLYSSRSRLFSEPGTLDFGTEIVRSISGILQFYAGSRQELPITTVYYSGCPSEDFEAGQEGIRGLGLKACPLRTDRRITFPPGERPESWLSCMGAMIRNGKRERQINLYSAALKALDQEPSSKTLLKHLTVPGLLLGTVLLLGGILWILNRNLEHRIQTIQDWMDNSKVQSQYQEAAALEARLLEIEGGIAAVERLEENLSSYPALSAQTLSRIEHAGGSGIKLEITGYDAQTGILTFRTGSREVIDVPSYILQMQETGIFHTMDYTGYTYENEWYTLSLSCVLAGNQRKGGDE